MDQGRYQKNNRQIGQPVMSDLRMSKCRNQNLLSTILAVAMVSGKSHSVGHADIYALLLVTASHAIDNE